MLSVFYVFSTLSFAMISVESELLFCGGASQFYSIYLSIHIIYLFLLNANILKIHDSSGLVELASIYSVTYMLFINIICIECKKST